MRGAAPRYDCLVAAAGGHAGEMYERLVTLPLLQKGLQGTRASCNGDVRYHGRGYDMIKKCTAGLRQKDNLTQCKRALPVWCVPAAL